MYNSISLVNSVVVRLIEGLSSKGTVFIKGVNSSRIIRACL